jgi:single-strand DNA-binding protein
MSNQTNNEEKSSTLFNSVSLVGRAGQDTEMRYFESGTAKAEVNLAVDRGKDKDGQKITDWFRVVFWGRQAEIAGEYVKKGSLIGVEGTIDINNWTDEASGEKRSFYFIKASTLRLIGGKKDNMG